MQYFLNIHIFATFWQLWGNKDPPLIYKKLYLKFFTDELSVKNQKIYKKKGGTLGIQFVKKEEEILFLILQKFIPICVNSSKIFLLILFQSVWIPVKYLILFFSQFEKIGVNYFPINRHIIAIFFKYSYFCYILAIVGNKDLPLIYKKLYLKFFTAEISVKINKNK